MKKHPLCELFLNFQNLKLSIMMLSPRSKQNQQADSLVDSDLKKSPKPSTRCHIWTDQCIRLLILLFAQRAINILNALKLIGIH